MLEAQHRHDISDEVWSRIEPHLPGRKGSWGRVAEDNRKFINAVFWVLRTGTPWRDLPPEYGDWKNTHRRFCRWRDKGIWEQLLDALVTEKDLEWIMIDATYIKAHMHAAGVKGGSQAIGRSKGGSQPRYIWPWTRMVCQSDSLLQTVSSLTAQKLQNLLKIQGLEA